MAADLDTAALLTTWERGHHERPGVRALILLAAARHERPSSAHGAVPIGERDGALLDLRRQLFGSRFTAVTTCPACAAEIELTFDVDEVRRETAFVRGDTMTDGDFEVEFRLPNAGDAASIEDARDVEHARRRLIERCVLRTIRQGAPAAASDLPERVVDAMIARMVELDPQADVPLNVTCPDCLRTWREPFDVVTFLWHEIDARARRLLEDVHTIASGYGWSEDEILRLSPARRAAYLELLR